MYKINAFLFLNISLAIYGFGQDFKRTLKEEVEVNSNENTIELVFSEPGEYVLAEGTSPKTMNWKQSIAVDGKKITIPRTIPRPFFGVITPKKDTLIVAERKLIINDLANFRDLGGIKTKEGKYVVWGRFYRSDALNELLTAEFPYVEGLGLRKVFDLRSASEIEKAKDNLPSNVIYEHFPIFSNKNSGLIDGLDDGLKKGNLTKAAAEELLLKMYQSFAKDDAKKFKSLLHQIMIQDDDPNVFHCTAGKDRTGYTAAMIFAILKVDRQTILDEYEMTNFYTKELIKMYAADVEKLGYGKQLSPEVVEVIMSVNKKYLETSFEIIDKKYGGIDAYIKNQLGFSDAVREKLIQKYTY